MKTIRIKIKKEDLPKPRLGVQPTKKHREKTSYVRKPKHQKKHEVR